jgi:hypothetical protein
VCIGERGMRGRAHSGSSPAGNYQMAIPANFRYQMPGTEQGLGPSRDGRFVGAIEAYVQIR